MRLLRTVWAGWPVYLVGLLFWLVALIQEHWDRSPYSCAPGGVLSYAAGGGCGRPLSGVLLILGFIAVVWLTFRYYPRSQHH